MPRRLGLYYALHPDGKRIVAHVAHVAPAAATTGDRLVFITNVAADLQRRARQSPSK